ncbi:DUF3011 domain-containing protein [Geminocystis sp. GBBB08]|uniref:DUF3011 domain-containing protein n=1 Tax=Geminocystis sp. GBBB08 TaxID=2604140 RepID=UPI0027E38F3E|nr:DUF3011 domain-containing protein [Geminocystis sp. GBBB08]
MIKNLHRLALISAISVGFFSQAHPASAESRITCESYRGRYNFCNVDTRGGVRFVRQISNAQCREGSTWGYERNGIWVDQGCSAEFAVRDRGGNNNNNNNYNTGGDNTGAIIGGLVVGAITTALASGSNNSNSNGTITCGSERGNFTR